ncbi:hypothetical protein GCM10008090_00020 [Arenicella chitinivorans]|uniref:Uncharacterized protein n=1 Tax=Arenicella chitinivorans TaxID=1329800 RepID=A0A918VEY5_9GAMM|nr:hypothetical protein [Arenicella chitinivorans]GGZ95887.1 hypothetical protein GCM10008090_00020 [Arenicella chitinivorans]
MFTKSKIIGALTVSLLAIGLYYWQSSQQVKVAGSDEEGHIEITLPQPQILARVDDDEQRSTNSNQERIETATSEEKVFNYDEDWCLSTDLSDEGREQSENEYTEWAASRNHLDGDRVEQFNRYTSYDIEALKALGDQGDLLALSAIVANPDVTDELKDKAAWTAAVYGGTGSAMSHFSTKLKGEAVAQMVAGKKVLAKKTFLESVAWDEFSAMRGDTLLIETIPFTLALDSMKEIQITEADEKWITQRARELYSKLSEERILMGLGEFDNTIPKVVAVERYGVAAYSIANYEQGEWYLKYFPPSECLDKRLELSASK